MLFSIAIYLKMMWDIDIKIAIINLLVIVGFNRATEFQYCYGPETSMPHCNKYGVDKHSTYVLWFIRYYCLKWFGTYWTKPICSCIPCMASIWGTAGYWITHPLSTGYIAGWLVYVLAIAGMGTIINKYING